MDGPPPLSSRGAAGTVPSLDYLEQSIRANADVFDPVQNPHGYVNMSVAENVLAFENLIRPRVVLSLGSLAAELANEVPKGPAAKIPPFYGDMKGHQNMRELVVKYLDWALLDNDPRYRFQWQNLIALAGCGEILDILSWSLFEAGDACLVPAPYYPAFDNDLSIRSQVKLVPVNQLQSDDSFALRENFLQEAYDKAIEMGAPPKGILLTNPQNPLGTCYSAEELLLAVRWARSKKLHIICDEIYAKSVHSVGEAEVPFTSICKIALNEAGNSYKLGEDIHIIYGLSKDFTLSGYRTGYLYSEHSQLQQAMFNFSYFGSTSTVSQQVTYELFSELDWTAHYISQNNGLLHNQCERARLWCSRVGVRFIKPTAGLFFVIYLGDLLPEPKTWQAERALFDAMYNEQKILLTPGNSCHCPSPGFFRLCYAGVSPQSLDEGLCRLEKFINRRRTSAKVE